MRRTLVAVVAGVVLAGCGGGGDGGPPSDSRAAAPDDRSQIERLLERRARALERGARRRYAGTAVGPQRARDRRAIRNRRGIALRKVRYEVDGLELRRRRARLAVRVTYGVRGVRGEYSAARLVVATRRGGDWRVRRETSPRDRFPWEVEPYDTSRTRHFVLLAPRGIDLAALEETLETAYAAISQRLVRPRPARRYLVVLARDAAAAQRLTAYIRGTSGLAALVDAKVRDGGPARQVQEVLGLRMVVLLEAFAPLPYEEQVRVLAHELSHAVLTRTTSGRTPAWLIEGLALYLSADRRVGQAAQLVASGSGGGQRRALTLTGLSRPHAIARMRGEAQTAAYAYASAAAHYVADRYGERRLLRLYSAFNDPRIPGRGGPETTDAATRRVLRRPLLALEEDLRRWIVTRAVVAPLSP